MFKIYSLKYAFCFNVLDSFLINAKFCRFVFSLKFHTVSPTGTVTYSEVRAFIEKQPDIMIQCKSIATVNETLILTGNHLVFAREKIASQFNPM